jgi:hypothetical protein
MSVLFAIPLAQARLVPYHPNPIQSVSVNFESGDRVTFHLRDNRVSSLDFHVRGAVYSTPLPGCLPLKNVQFESAAFFLGEEDRRAEGTFTLTFRMGTEAERQFGELPMVQINFLKKQFTRPQTTHWIAANSSYSSLLCTGAEPTE